MGGRAGQGGAAGVDGGMPLAEVSIHSPQGLMLSSPRSSLHPTLEGSPGNFWK